MKIQAVSITGFKSRNMSDRNDLNYPFLYSPAPSKSNQQIKNFGIVTGLLALTAVGVTLFNLKRAQKFPKDIIELPNMEKGLNKITDFHKTVNDLKSKFMYPLKCAIMSGQENPKKFKSGVIFINESKTPTEKVMSAFLEHLNELEIDTETVHTLGYKTCSDGVKILRELKRNEIVKEVFSLVKRAEQKYIDEGKYTVINLGNLEKLTRLRAVKSQKSNIEQLLEDISNNKYKGVLWAAESTNHEAMPLFFNNLPVLITKLMD